MNFDDLQMKYKYEAAMVALLLFIITVIFYLSGINDYFIADSLVGLNLGWRDVLSELISNGCVFGYRPIGVAWFVTNNSLWGNFATGHRLMAFALHAANGTLIFLITRRFQKNLIVAALASVLFISHPAQVETVQWLAATAGSATSALFYLLSIWFWIKSAGLPPKKAQFLSAFFFLLALLTKEISAALPITLILLDGYMKRIKPSQNLTYYLKWMISYWPFAASFLFYLSGYYFSGSFNHSFSETSNGYNNFQVLFDRFDQFFNLLLMPLSVFAEWRTGHVGGLWILVFMLMLHLSKSARLIFILTLINLFPGIFYFADRLTYLPVAFLTIGISILCFHFFQYILRMTTSGTFKNLLKVAAVLVFAILLVMNFRFVNRRLAPWHNAARLCKSIPEKIAQLIPNPAPGSQLILVNMSFTPGIPVSLWALFSETERRYHRPDLEIRQIYDGPDVLNLINIKSIPCKSDRTRYFIKYFQLADSVGFVSAVEAGIKCPD